MADPKADPTPSLLQRKERKRIHERASAALGRLHNAAAKSLKKFGGQAGKMRAQDLEEEVERATGENSTERQERARADRPLPSR